MVTMRTAVTTPNKWVLYKVYNDAQARENLILENVSLVKYVAERVKDTLPSEIDKEDLVSYGIFGLIDAIEKFDHNRGLKFETYAIPRIRGAIVDGLRAVDTASRSMRQKAKQLGKAYVAVEKRVGRAATDNEVAQELGMNTASYNAMISQVSRLSVLYLDEIVSHDGEPGATLGERVEDKNSFNPSDLMEINEVRDSLIQGIESLSEQERLVISLYYYEDLTLKETSQVMGLSESRIAQIRVKAVLKLRGKLSHLSIDF
ncbi:MAG TPA: FliA/WhiG family RNA polymerase sigma factor [Candidatus Aquicultor sp.]|jgi:RNA polymerase sigma factor for flagellar operon FliA